MSVAISHNGVAAKLLLTNLVCNDVREVVTSIGAKPLKKALLDKNIKLGKRCQIEAFVIRNELVFTESLYIVYSIIKLQRFL